MVRCFCPCSSVDWSQGGGLACCNWPVCDDMQQSEVNIRLRSPSRIVFTTDRSNIPPCFFMCFASVVPFFPCLIMMDDNMAVTAWDFERTSESLQFRLRKKHGCSESNVQHMVDVTEVSYETTQDFDAKTGFNTTKARLVIKGTSVTTAYTPYKSVQDDSLKQICSFINEMLPQRLFSTLFYIE